LAVIAACTGKASGALRTSGALKTLLSLRTTLADRTGGSFFPEGALGAHCSVFAVDAIETWGAARSGGACELHVLDRSDKIGVGLDSLFHIIDVASDHVNTFVNFLHLGAEALDKGVVERRSNVGFAKDGRPVCEDRVRVGSDETVVDARLRMHGFFAERVRVTTSAC